MTAMPPSTEKSGPRDLNLPPHEQSSVVNRESLIGRVAAYRWFWALALACFVLDQATKAMIVARLPFGSFGPGSRIDVIPGFFHLVHVGNTGAAWSMFSGKSTGLAILALVTLGALFYWRKALGLPHGAVQPAFGLLCGGIVGNLVDRLRVGHVIDFLDFHFGGYIYPTFNVADSGICIGVFWYVLWSLRQPAAEENSRET